MENAETTNRPETITREPERPGSYRPGSMYDDGALDDHTPAEPTEAELVPSPRYQIRYNEIDDQAKRFDERLSELDVERFDLDERARKLGKEFDDFLAAAADDLDDDDFHEIFGTYPDRSNRPETKGF